MLSMLSEFIKNLVGKGKIANLSLRLLERFLELALAWHISLPCGELVYITRKPNAAKSFIRSLDAPQRLAL